MAGTAEGRRQGLAAAATFRSSGGSSNAAVRLDPEAIQRLLTSENGPVGRDLLRRAVRVEAAAKRACPVDTGRLRASLTHVIEEDGEGLYAVVGTNVEYAIYVELGTGRTRAQPYLRPALRAAR